MHIMLITTIKISKIDPIAPYEMDVPSAACMVTDKKRQYYKYIFPNLTINIVHLK